MHRESARLQQVLVVGVALLVPLLFPWAQVEHACTGYGLGFRAARARLEQVLAVEVALLLDFWVPRHRRNTHAQGVV